MHLIYYEDNLTRELKAITAEERWHLFQAYLKNDLSYQQMADAYDVKKESIEHFILILWRKFQNVHAAKTIKSMNPVDARDVPGTLERIYAKSDAVNEKFLKKLSKEEELMSDGELLFAEFLLEFGDDVKALERSKLNIGLNKADKPSYTEACRIRAMYLKRKPNVKSYIYEMRKRNLVVLEKDGKSYIQSNLIQLIEQLGKSQDKGSLTSQLKAIEHLARSVGAFEDKIVVESVNGDEVLNRIINKAREAKVKRDPIALEDGITLYEAAQ